VSRAVVHCCIEPSSLRSFVGLPTGFGTSTDQAIHFQTLIASKAARCVLAAPGKTLIDFGLRRAHGAEAGLLAARATYIAGFSGTSTVLAEAEFGIPIYGTMAHSFVQAHASEAEAFEHFARVYPSSAVLLIDTYDTLAAAQTVTRLVKQLRPEGLTIRAVRIDSGDLAALVAKVREILDSGGCQEISTFCSGGLDEYALATKFGDAPVDGFGIGTRLNVSADAPYLDCAYKIEEYAGVPRRKRSTGKKTWPGRKQVFRMSDADGGIRSDVVTVADEQQDGRTLLEPVMQNGARIATAPNLKAIRDHAAAELASLPQSMRDPLTQTGYAVEISTSLRALASRVDGMFRRGS